MPANKKYLSTAWQQFAKLTAGLIGGYILSALICMCFALAFPYHKEALITSVYLLFLLWVTFMIVPYLFKNGWKAWGIYAFTIIALYAVYYFLNQQNPFI